MGENGSIAVNRAVCDTALTKAFIIKKGNNTNGSVAKWAGKESASQPSVWGGDGDNSCQFDTCVRVCSFSFTQTLFRAFSFARFLSHTLAHMHALSSFRPCESSLSLSLSLSLSYCRSRVLHLTLARALSLLVLMFCSDLFSQNICKTHKHHTRARSISLSLSLYAHMCTASDLCTASDNL